MEAVCGKSRQPLFVHVSKMEAIFSQHNQTRHQRYRTERRFALIRGEIACSRECECGPAT